MRARGVNGVRSSDRLQWFWRGAQVGQPPDQRRVLTSATWPDTLKGTEQMAEIEIEQHVTRMLHQMARDEALTQIEGLAARIKEARPSLSKEQAIAEALRRQPHLYTEYTAGEFAAPKPAPPAMPAVAGRLQSWADVEAKARELFRAGTFPTYELAIAHLVRNDADARKLASLKSEGLI